MECIRYKPLVDLTYCLLFATALLPAVAVVVAAAFHPPLFFVAIPTLLFVAYFAFSSLFGYVELRERSVFVKLGFFMKREIAYSDIRRVERERKLYSESMTSLKNALEHVNIRYGSFDVLTVSVVDNDAFAVALKKRCGMMNE